MTVKKEIETRRRSQEKSENSFADTKAELKAMNSRMNNAEEIKLPTPTGSWKKQERSRKTSISALLTMPKPLTVWITRNCGKL